MSIPNILTSMQDIDRKYTLCGVKMWFYFYDDPTLVDFVGNGFSNWNSYF